MVAGIPILGLLGTTAILGAEPATGIPFQPPPAEQWKKRDLIYGDRAESERPRFILTADNLIAFSAALEPDVRRSFTRWSLSQEFMGRMEREYVRYQQRHPHDPALLAGPLDSIAEEQRAYQAERVLTRAFDKTMTSYLEEVARTSLGLGPLLDWADGARSPQLRFGRSGRTAPEAGDPPGAGQVAPPAESRVGIGGGFKVDAHPRLVLRPRFFGVRARIEVPVRDEPLRLSVTRSFGRRAHAALSASIDDEPAENWTALHLAFSF